MSLFTYNPGLVLLSVVISMMSAFTGLSLTRGLSAKTIGQRQARIIMAAIALGGGIWSMHFVAMLAMRFPVPVFYEVIETVASALTAILMSGLALLILHFGRRSQAAIQLAGMIPGLGIVGMHFIGLSVIKGCSPVNQPLTCVLAGALAMGMGIVSIHIAYGTRNERNILVATLVFGAAVAVVQFSAIALTDFIPGPPAASTSPVMANAQIAILVLVSGFVISGAFLLSGASFMSGPVLFDKAGPSSLSSGEKQAGPGPSATLVRRVNDPAPLADLFRLPYERDGKTMLVGFEKVSALRADGHYTTAFLASGPVFCPWSITDAETRMPPGFIRAHRSWLVNLSVVSGFERTRENGWCLFGATTGLTRVPVSRAKVTALRHALGL